MKDEQLDDLKQFIASQTSQSESRIDKKIDNLQKIMEDGFAGVGEAIERNNSQLDDHESRINALEAQSA